MVRFTALLCRIPVIKFKKGGSAQSGGSGAPPPAASLARPPSCPAPSRQPTGAAASAAMSTRAAIPDIDLPARYRRQPISEEEINHINGGGVV